MSENSHIKLLITAGCSFTEIAQPEAWNKKFVDTSDYPDLTFNWPVYLNNYMQVDTYYRGSGASGNGIISRSVIHGVTQALTQYQAKELLVGIMWSGPDRYEFYLSDTPADFESLDTCISTTRNPTSIIDGPSRVKYIGIDDFSSYNYYRVNAHWNDNLSTVYYKNFYDKAGSQLLTLEHILRVQWFLKLHGIKYFMTCYTSEVLPKDFIFANDELKYLYDLIDFSNFLPVDNEYDWVKKHYPNTDFNKHAHHPDNDGHKGFAEQVIIPFLKDKGYIK